MVRQEKMGREGRFGGKEGRKGGLGKVKEEV